MASPSELLGSRSDLTLYFDNVHRKRLVGGLVQQLGGGRLRLARGNFSQKLLAAALGPTCGVRRGVQAQDAALVLQLDGATQSGATTLNFIANSASFANNVLNISRMAWQDKVVLRYSNAASDKDLDQGSSGQLRWNGADVAMASDVAAKQDSLTAGAGIS